MTIVKKTNSEDPNFIALVEYLDADLKIRDGEDHEFYNQFNKIHNLKYCLVAYYNNKPVGCGAIKPFNESAMEVKRMFVLQSYRGKGIASKILIELEHWAKVLNYSECILETGIKQPEAIALYKKNGFQVMENYGQYKGVANSVCFKKML